MADQGLKAMAGRKAPKFGHFIVEFATPGIGLHPEDRQGAISCSSTWSTPAFSSRR